MPQAHCILAFLKPKAVMQQLIIPAAFGTKPHINDLILSA